MVVRKYNDATRDKDSDEEGDLTKILPAIIQGTQQCQNINICEYGMQAGRA